MITDQGDQDTHHVHTRCRKRARMVHNCVNYWQRWEVGGQTGHGGQSSIGNVGVL
jgi:hypothetical protein